MGSRRILLLALIPAIAGFLILTLNIALAQGGGVPDPASIVISEVMYNAVTETAAYGYGEWLEIYNKGAVTVDLAGWMIRDNTATDTITYSMCPNNSCELPPGGCWLIAWNQTYLQAEFNFYTSPLSPTVDPSRTIFLGDEIGNGLSNSSDYVVLKTPQGENVDCVSWNSQPLTICGSLNYVNGGNGKDTNLYRASEGQSIANIGGEWYYHQSNASPYNCINTAVGGNPTVVTVLGFSVKSYVSFPVLALCGIITALIAGLKKGVAKRWLETHK